eukprot:4445376-Pyramimonas_sp.AAC.2
MGFGWPAWGLRRALGLRWVVTSGQEAWETPGRAPIEPLGSCSYSGTLRATSEEPSGPTGPRKLFGTHSERLWPETKVRARALASGGRPFVELLKDPW